MPQYLICFNQQWVGEHSSDWFAGRGPLARAVVAEMKAVGVLVFAGGMDEDYERAIGIDVVDGKAQVMDGPYGQGRQYLGGFTIVDVPDETSAREWGIKIAEACGWPQEIRRVKS